MGPPETLPLNSRKPERSPTVSSAFPTQKTATPGTTLSSDLTTRSSREASTWEKLSAHQSTQPRHQRSSFLLPTEDSTPGTKVSAFPSLTTIQSHGTQSGKFPRSSLDSPPSGRPQKTHTEGSTATKFKACARMVRPKSTLSLEWPRSPETGASSTRNSPLQGVRRCHWHRQGARDRRLG